VEFLPVTGASPASSVNAGQFFINSNNAVAIFDVPVVFNNLKFGGTGSVIFNANATTQISFNGNQGTAILGTGVTVTGSPSPQIPVL
jgi:hypothetical protein